MARRTKKKNAAKKIADGMKSYNEMMKIIIPFLEKEKEKPFVPKEQYDIHHNTCRKIKGGW